MTSSNEGRTPSGLFSFRVATPADATLLPRVARECYLPWYDHLWLPGERDAYLDRTYAPTTVERELADPNVVYEFAYRGDRPVAFLKLELRRDRAGVSNAAYLERVYVSDAVGGAGVGTLLMERAFERSRSAGRERIWLKAMDSAHRPIERYLALGFRDVGGEVLDMPGMKPEYRGMRVLVREL